MQQSALLFYSSCPHFPSMSLRSKGMFPGISCMTSASMGGICGNGMSGAGVGRTGRSTKATLYDNATVTLCCDR